TDSSKVMAQTVADCDLLIKNAHIVSMDEQRHVFPNGAISIVGRDIQAVGPERELLPFLRPKQVIDAHGAPVHPGFIESHVHLMHIVRGAFPDLITDYNDAVSRYTRWWDALEDEDEYAGAL